MGSDAFDRPADDPALDRVFDVLADERRRDVLYFLQKGADDTANVETLADHLAGSESSERDDSETAGESDRSETIDEREQTIAIQLSHVHLPNSTRRTAWSTNPTPRPSSTRATRPPRRYWTRRRWKTDSCGPVVAVP